MVGRPIVAVALTLALLAPLGARAGTEERAAEHRKRAAEFLQEGKIPDAISELRSAVQLEPGNADAHRALADAYLKAKDGQSAFREYQEVVSLDPEDGDAQLRVAGFYLLGRRYRDAAEHAARAAELLKGRFEPHAVLARARAGEQDWEGAVAEEREAIALAPDNEALRAELARLYLVQKKPELAEKVLRDGLEAIPPSKTLRAALASLLASEKRYAEADTLMEELLNLGRENPAVLRVVARYRLKRGDWEGAEKLLRRELELAGENKPQRLQALGDLVNFYSVRGDLAKARSTLEELQKLAPTDDLTLARLANLHLLLDEPDEAAPLIETLAKRAPEAPNTRLLKARLDLARGRVKAAQEALEEVVKEVPDSVNGNLFLGKAYAMEGQWEKARAAYLRVLEEVPAHFFANLDLAKVDLKLGRPRDALEAIGKVLKSRPGLVDALAVQADAELALGRPADAEATYRQLLKASPGKAVLELRLGQALAAQGRNEEALTHLEAARKLDPKALNIILLQLGVLERLGRKDEVGRVARTYLAENGDAVPVLNVLALNAAGQGDAEAAKAYVKRSLAVEPKNPATRELQARILLSEKDVDGARSALEAALESAPDRVSSLILLANIAEKSGKPKKASSLYEHVLRVQPGNALAANNLAAIYLNDPTRIQEALKLAQTAAEKAPKSPAVQDTLGWAQFKSGSPDLAVRSLEQAHQGMPSQPEIAYHLGMVYAKLGRKEEAEKLLRDALAAPGGGSWVPEARRTLEQLGGSAR